RPAPTTGAPGSCLRAFGTPRRRARPARSATLQTLYCLHACVDSIATHTVAQGYSVSEAACNATSIRRRGVSSEGKKDPVRVLAILTFQVTSGRGDGLVPDSVPIRRAGVGAFVWVGADVLGRFDVDQGLQQLAHQLTTIGAAQRLGQLQQGRL